ncbi:50S ribosomal protein L23 [Candidatus Methylocalor cossyra]|uniref:50S ribosomal protein L23 n=1 Tax=Candidatus Methylocalor cossyra TaxID=3108543 RepID=UPI0032B2A667
MRTTDLMAILQAPIISEKTSTTTAAGQQVAFRVRKDATKHQVKRAVELLFKVQVASVNILNVKKKKKRFGRSIGFRSAWKKAYVTLKSGFSIDFASA